MGNGGTVGRGTQVSGSLRDCEAQGYVFIVTRGKVWGCIWPSGCEDSTQRAAWDLQGAAGLVKAKSCHAEIAKA